MNAFDTSIIEFVLRHVDRKIDVYRIIQFWAEGDNLLKGGIFSMLIWYCWFNGKAPLDRNREAILLNFLAVFVAMVLTLSLAGGTPFRPRPFIVPALHFTTPLEPGTYLSKMSSFPSDHATLFMTLSTGIFFNSKRIGAFCYLYTVLFIMFPRLYLGYHYPTDLLMGSAIGISISCFFQANTSIRSWIRQRVLPWEKSKPAFFYPILFLITYEIADLFAGSRDLLSFCWVLIRH